MGIEFNSLQDGDGTTYPKPGQIVVVHYTGTLPDGSIFDSSRDRETLFKFRLGAGEVIKGWDEGIRRMSVGQRAVITCPPEYAYGKKGFPGVIPPNTTLTFDIELVQLE